MNPTTRTPEQLRADVKSYLDAALGHAWTKTYSTSGKIAPLNFRELAGHFGISTSTVFAVLQQLADGAAPQPPAPAADARRSSLETAYEAGATVPVPAADRAEMPTPAPKPKPAAPKPTPPAPTPAAHDAAVAAALAALAAALDAPKPAAPTTALDPDAVREIVRPIALEEVKLHSEAARENLFTTALDLEMELANKAAELAKNLPPVYLLEQPNGDRTRIETAAGDHPKLPLALAILRQTGKLLLVGPAGSGKTTIAKRLAALLEADYHMLSLSGGVTESALIGRPTLDGSGYIPGPYLTAYENGGVILLDELDAADANVLVSVNASLANGHLAAPLRAACPLAKRHDKTYIVGAANTFGHGADRAHSARQSIDVTTLDRFAGYTLWIDYNTALETALAGGAEKPIARALWYLREQAKAKGWTRRLVTTRAFEACRNLAAIGLSDADAIGQILLPWTASEFSAVAPGLAKIIPNVPAPAGA